MPHIVFDQKIQLDDFAKKFNPIFKKEPNLIRISTIFVDKDNKSALLPVVSVSKINQKFFIEISTNHLKTTIRLLPMTDPIKTNEVKESMALLARQILQIYNNFKIIKTNIEQTKEMISI